MLLIALQRKKKWKNKRKYTKKVYEKKQKKRMVPKKDNFTPYRYPSQYIFLRY